MARSTVNRGTRSKKVTASSRHRDRQPAATSAACSAHRCIGACILTATAAFADLPEGGDGLRRAGRVTERSFHYAALGVVDGSQQGVNGVAVFAVADVGAGRLAHDGRVPEQVQVVIPHLPAHPQQPRVVA